MTGRRPRWRSYLLLARVSNLPTVWTNVLAGLVLTGMPFDGRLFLQLAAGVSLMYSAGMFLNDYFDREIDGRLRPQRPLPSGDVSANEVASLGTAFLAAGLVVIGWARPHGWPWAIVLATAILYYDYRHKRDRLGPAVMGLCRALVYCVSAAATAGITAAVLVGAGVMWAYVTGLTLVSKRMGAKASVVVPKLLAGISIVDGLLILPFAPALASGGIAAFVATLVAQRAVPGD